MQKRQTQRPQPQKSPSPQKSADPVIHRGVGMSREDARRGTYVPGQDGNARPAGLNGRS